MRPLRLIQERLLLGQELARRMGHEPSPFRLFVGMRSTRRIDIDALKIALNTVVARHSALRTAFICNPRVGRDGRDYQLKTFSRLKLFVPGLYLQTIRSSSDAIEVLDRRCAETEEQALRAVEAEANRPFDLADARTLRVTLIHQPPTGDVVVLIVSHVVADGTSLSILAHELAGCYESLVVGCPTPVVRPVGQHYELAEWEHGALRSGAFDTGITYWKRLWDEYGRWQMRFDRGDDVASEQRVESALTEEWRLDADASAEVRAACRRERVTPYMLFRCGLAVALCHITGQPRLAIGGNYGTRDGSRFAGAVGWFNNRHLIPLRVAGLDTYKNLLDDVRGSTLEALRHHHVPVQALWHRLGTAGDFGRDILLSTFDYRVQPRESTRLAGGIQLDPLRDVLRRSIRPGLDIRVIDDGLEFTMRVTFSPRRFPRATIQALVYLMKGAAQAVSREPGKRLSSALAS